MHKVFGTFSGAKAKKKWNSLETNYLKYRARQAACDNDGSFDNTFPWKDEMSFLDAYYTVQVYSDSPKDSTHRMTRSPLDCTDLLPGNSEGSLNNLGQYNQLNSSSCYIGYNIL